MAEATKTSFLGSISPWSRSSTPPPKSPRQPPNKDDNLRQSIGADHLINLRPTPSPRKYPKDCPALKTRWYYAVDIAKRKPFAPTPNAEDKSKLHTAPKKWVLFSSSDSYAIESAFQALDRNDLLSDDSKPTSTKVPVNEDYLFDVHVEKRELEPAYWLGPIYEVRRGSWFYSEGSVLRPCDENLANQLEEGYIKVRPWRRIGQARSASQNRSRPSSTVIAGAQSDAKPSDSPTEGPLSNTQRLFGSHMNTIVTYQDATVAYLSSDDLMSRIGSSVYTRFGGQGGTKIVRGFSENKVTDVKVSDPKAKEKSAQSSSESSTEPSIDSKAKSPDHETVPPRPSALERQLSSLAGLVESKDEERLAEEDARQAQEQEMEDAREKDGEDQARRIDHLVLVTHGIGQRLGLRLDSINFIHDVNTLRKTIKAVYGSAPDLQALTGDPQNSTIQVLPICWRHLLDFPKQSLKQNRKEFDLGDMDSGLEDEYPSLQDITVEGVPAVRNLITDLAMDVLLYQSAYREHIASIVQKEANRIYKLFKQRTGFNGKVSLCGHSLGSAVIFDILCRQEGVTINRPRRVSSRTSRDVLIHDQNEVKLDFECENFFALGSPIALFQMLKGRTVAGRQSLHDKAPVTSPFDTPSNQIDPFSPGGSGTNLIPITVSSPKCNELFNIFHPTDPIAYRIEPLISPAMAQLKPQPLPYVKKGLFGAPGIANMTARVGQQVMSSWYSLTSGVASSLINRSLGITGDEQALPQGKPRSNTLNQIQSPLQSGQTVPQTSGNTMPLSDGQKQADLARTLSNSDDDPSKTKNTTLIDSEIETLYSGFQKRRRLSQSSNHSSSSTTVNIAGEAEATTTTATNQADPPPLNIEDLTTAEKARKLRREEAKVRALNSNGRVDYHIQEGMFDVSLLASIASHLSYWADEDVNHFMVGQMLKRGPVGDVGSKRNSSVGGGNTGGGSGNVSRSAVPSTRNINSRTEDSDSERMRRREEALM